MAKWIATGAHNLHEEFDNKEKAIRFLVLYYGLGTHGANELRETNYTALSYYRENEYAEIKEAE